MKIINYLRRPEELSVQQNMLRTGVPPIARFGTAHFMYLRMYVKDAYYVLPERDVPVKHYNNIYRQYLTILLTSECIRPTGSLYRVPRTGRCGREITVRVFARQWFEISRT